MGMQRPNSAAKVRIAAVDTAAPLPKPPAKGISDLKTRSPVGFLTPQYSDVILNNCWIAREASSVTGESIATCFPSSTDRALSTVSEVPGTCVSAQRRDWRGDRRLSIYNSMLSKENDLSRRA